LSSEDIVQEMLLSAWDRFDQFQGESQQELRAWLEEILTNCLGMAIRSHRGCQARDVNREQSLDDRGGGAAAVACGCHSPLAELIRREKEQAVQAALAGLSEDDQQVIRFRFHEGIPFEEIGRRMRTSADYARKMCARAVDRLRKRLGESGLLEG
jgi:RNA polymerase sigma-70 factor (subfamily 1)